MEHNLDELRVRISRNNRRIRLVSAHADNYKDFLNYVTGQVPEVSDGTAKFLEAENRKDLLDVIHFKRMGDCMEEALVGQIAVGCGGRAFPAAGQPAKDG